jgi:predicted phosphodiesterase
LGRAAEFILNVAKVDRAVYLGDDGALESTVTSWAERLVGADPTDAGTFRRAAVLAVKGDPAQIDRFVVSERARLRLRALESLPGGDGRTIEMIGDRVAVLIHDKANLDEEDIVSANLLVYGKSAEPLIRKIGARWFISPGVLGCPKGGVAVIEDKDEKVVAEIFDDQGTCTLTESLDMTRKTTTKVQGG